MTPNLILNNMEETKSKDSDFYKMYTSPTKEEIEAQQKIQTERDLPVFYADKPRSGHSSPVLRSSQLEGNLAIFKQEQKQIDETEDFLLQ